MFSTLKPFLGSEWTPALFYLFDSTWLCLRGSQDPKYYSDPVFQVPPTRVRYFSVITSFTATWLRFHMSRANVRMVVQARCRIHEGVPFACTTVLHESSSTLAKELFNAALLSCGIKLDDQYQVGRVQII